MKKMNIAAVLTVLVMSAFFLTGCGPSEKEKRLSEMRFQEKVRVFEADIKARMQDLEMRLEMLQGKGLHLSEKARDLWLEASGTYEEKQRLLTGLMDQVTGQTQATWAEYKTEVEKQWQQVEASFQKLKDAAGKRE